MNGPASTFDRCAWAALESAKYRKRIEVEAVYLAHMSKAAHCLYLAGEAVKNGESGYADSQHQLADLHIAAARNSIGFPSPADLAPFSTI